MREELAGGDTVGGTVFTAAVEGGEVNVAVAGTFVNVGEGEVVNVGAGVFVGATGWKGVADADVCPFGITNSAKGSGVGVSVAGGAQEINRMERRTQRAMRNELCVPRFALCALRYFRNGVSLFFIDRRCGSIG